MKGNPYRIRCHLHTDYVGKDLWDAVVNEFDWIIGMPAAHARLAYSSCIGPRAVLRRVSIDYHVSCGKWSDFPLTEMLTKAD